MVFHAEHTPRKKKGGNQKNDLIVNMPVQAHQRMDTLMALTA